MDYSDFDIQELRDLCGERDIYYGMNEDEGYLIWLLERYDLYNEIVS